MNCFLFWKTGFVIVIHALNGTMLILCLLFGGATIKVLSCLFTYLRFISLLTMWLHVFMQASAILLSYMLTIFLIFAPSLRELQELIFVSWNFSIDIWLSMWRNLAQRVRRIGPGHHVRCVNIRPNINNQALPRVNEWVNRQWATSLMPRPTYM